jgi:hypothetical protein
MSDRNLPARNIPIGEPSVRTTTPSHTPGTREGNAPGSYEKMRGHRADGSSTAERSTGIHHRGKDPIDPRMPNLSPA